MRFGRVVHQQGRISGGQASRADLAKPQLAACHELLSAHQGESDIKTFRSSHWPHNRLLKALES